MTYYTPNIWGVFFDLTNKFHKKPPFAYEKVENRKKIGTILMRDVLRTLIRKKNFSQQLY